MVPISRLCSVKAVGEEAALLKVEEDRGAVVDAGKTLSQLGVDLLKDRGRQEEVADLLGLLFKNLLCEEGEQVAVRRGRNGVDEGTPLFGRFALPERYLDELKAGCPSLCFSLELN